MPASKQRKKKRDRWIPIMLQHWGYACAYCADGVDEDDVTVDHVVPVDLGGSDRLENWAPACHRCNSDKSNMTLKCWIKVKRVDVDRFHGLREIWCTFCLTPSSSGETHATVRHRQDHRIIPHPPHRRPRRDCHQLPADRGSMEPGGVRGLSPPRPARNGSSCRASDAAMWIKGLDLQPTQWEECGGSGGRPWPTTRSSGSRAGNNKIYSRQRMGAGVICSSGRTQPGS